MILEEVVAYIIPFLVIISSIQVNGIARADYQGLSIVVIPNDDKEICKIALFSQDIYVSEPLFPDHSINIFRGNSTGW